MSELFRVYMRNSFCFGGSEKTESLYVKIMMIPAFCKWHRPLLSKAKSRTKLRDAANIIASAKSINSSKVLYSA